MQCRAGVIAYLVVRKLNPKLYFRFEKINFLIIYRDFDLHIISTKSPCIFVYKYDIFCGHNNSVHPLV